MDFISKLENQAFDSYDGDNYDADGYDADGYDADNATGPRKVMPRPRTLAPASALRKSSLQTPKGGPVAANNFTITITNDDTTASTVQLFYAQNSVSEVSNPELPLHVPLLSATVSSIPNGGDPATTAIFYGRLGTAIAGKTGVYWNEQGDLVFITDNGNTTIHCNEIPYRDLFNHTRNNSILITRIRMTVTNQAQFNNSFNFVERTIFGMSKTNVLAPNNEFSPDQFQSLKLDIPKKIPIDKQKGWNYRVESGNTVQMVMSIAFYSQAIL